MSRASSEAERYVDEEPLVGALDGDDLETSLRPPPHPRSSAPTSYERLILRSGHFNVSVSRLSWWSQLRHWSPYHAILNLPWWQLLLASAAYWVVLNLLFALLYFADLEHLQEASSFQDAFFFSLQTMSTVGYGNLIPRSLYLQIVVTAETWLALIADSVIVAVIISKVARPSRLRHTVQFSAAATLNCSEPVFSSLNAADALAGVGDYAPSVPALTFRLLNLRKRQLCSPSLRLYLLRRSSAEQPTRARTLYELDYELAEQRGRARGINYALPHLPLPWTVVHKIDAQSPLHGMTRAAMLAAEVEVLAVLDAIDELTSASFQVRWSYLPTEMRWAHQFDDMLTRNARGRLAIDAAALSSTHAINDPCHPDLPLK